MIPLIGQLLQFGYTAQMVISYLGANVPNLQRGIQSAQKAGHSADQILKYLSTNLKPKNQDQYKQTLSANEKYLSSLGITNKKERDQKRSKVLGAALGVGAGYLAGKGLSYLQNRGTQAIQPNQILPAQQPINPPQLSPPQPPTIPVTPIPMNPIGPAGGQPPGPPNAPTGPAPRPGPMPTPGQAPVQQLPNPAAQAPTVPASQVLGAMGLNNHVDTMIQAGNKPDAIAAMLDNILTPGQRKWFDDQQKQGNVRPLNELVGEYVQESQQNAAPQQQELPQEPIEEEPVNVKPFDKGTEVLTPNGEIGEIVANNGKDLLVKENGKTKKFNADELEHEPEEAIEAVQNILKIPEVDRSSIVSLFSYDPSDEEMFIQFHTGDSYKYLDVPLQKVITIANKLGIPITEGKNIFGGWSPEDKKSLGATLIKEIIADPKYKKSKKGEPENPNYRKLDTYYDYWEKLRKKPKKKR